MRRATTAFALLVATASSRVDAQTSSIPHGPELRVLAGASLPAGAQRREFRGAPIGTVQGALSTASGWHVVGSLAWIATTSKRSTRGAPDDRTNVVQGDVGIERHGSYVATAGWTIDPIAGVGVGGRVYDYGEAAFATTTAPVAYGMLGLELRQGRGAVHLAMRDDVYRFRVPNESTARVTRSDVAMLVGLTYHWRSPRGAR